MVPACLAAGSDKLKTYMPSSPNAHAQIFLLQNKCWVAKVRKNRCPAVNLKFVSAIFCQFFYFSPNNSPSKTMKNVFYFI